MTARYDGRELASEANRWTGRNRSGYQNPRADQLADLLSSTIDTRARLPLLREQIQIFTSDVVLLPLYWETGTTMAVKGVKANIHPGNAAFRTDLWEPRLTTDNLSGARGECIPGETLTVGRVSWLNWATSVKERNNDDGCARSRTEPDGDLL